MLKKEIIENMVRKMKKEILFNYEFYTQIQEIESLYFRYIQQYPDSKQYQNMRKSVLKALYKEVQSEKAYYTMKRESTPAHDSVLYPLKTAGEKDYATYKSTIH